MTIKLAKIIIAVLFLGGSLLGLYDYFDNHQKAQESKEYAKQLKKQFDQRIMEYNQQLNDKEVEKAVLRHQLDSVLVEFSNLRRVDSINSIRQSKIKGMFDTLKSKQLQDKMVDEYNKSKQP